ncbi:hypothetical protein [Streptomyces flaveolus]|uniref:Uncharacterized protein n=1 Tax=Streptomyces flaveolus TaxID=67297 RepID=A0ABV3AQ55_9ACTN
MVYDPVSRLCSAASAGHVPPVVVRPPEKRSAVRAHPGSHRPQLPIGPCWAWEGSPSG